MLIYNNPFWRLVVRGRRWLGRYPALYYPVARVVKPRTFPWRFADRDTELVMDAYPGSGNTFGFTAFEYAQGRPTTMAHHVHVPAQIMRGIKLQLPTVLLLREPDEAVSSNLARWGHLTVREALVDYSTFYEPLWPLREEFLTVHFKDVVGDFGAVTERINRRFGTSFEPFEHTEENVNACLARMKEQESSNWDRNVPQDARKREKQEIIAELQSAAYAPLRDACYAWYDKFLPLTRRE